MHNSVLEFIRVEVATRNLSKHAVVEVGALNVNGSARQYFAGNDYIGVDMREGPGVDVVANAHYLTSVLQYRYGVVLCTEMLEHDDDPWTSLRQMYEVAVPRAHLLLTCRGYDQRGCFPVHAYPDDFWRFSCGGIDALLHQTGWQPEAIKRDPEAPGVFAVAVKPCD